ncbi:MAG: PTS IIA-like nitrogen regulatory protein PtsN [Pseudomonadota bacterium]
MNLEDLLCADSVLINARASCKKQVLQLLAEKASESCDMTAREIFDVVLQREKLGSTGVGKGVAIPHGKFPGLDKIVGVFAQLHDPIDFEAIDDQPVDLVFLLMAPEQAGADHLKALSSVARVLRDKDRLEALRGAQKASDVHKVLCQRLTQDVPEADAA